MLSYRFIDELGEKNLLTYKYSGSDHSLLYKYVFSPLSQLLVDKLCPTWLAPNVITLMGLFSTLIPHVILWILYSGELAGNVPAWLCYVCGLSQFLYIILDNADGKQARRTKSSSPLGLLFDHGCDAVNTFIAGINLFIVVQFGNSPHATVAYVCCLLPFYMATWEEYYTDHLTLPIINGPNEGIAAIIGLFIMSGTLGNNIWIAEYAGIPVNVIALGFFNILGIFNSLLPFLSVLNKRRDKIGEAVSNLGMLVYIVITTLVVSYLSPTNVISRKARFIIYIIGLGFSKIMSHLQVSHVTTTKFIQFLPSVVIPFTILNLNTTIGFYFGKAPIDEDWLINILMICSLLTYAHYAVNVISQFCKVLNIFTFRIGSRKPNKEN